MRSLWTKWMALFFALSLLVSCGNGGGGGETGNPAGGGTLTARISGPGTVNTQTAFLNTLDGTSSSDPQGLPLTYSWTFQSIPAGSATRIDGADQAKSEFEPDVAGTYVVQLVVSNGTTSSQPASQTFIASGATTGWKRMGEVLDTSITTRTPRTRIWPLIPQATRWWGGKKQTRTLPT